MSLTKVEFVVVANCQTLTLCVGSPGICTDITLFAQVVELKLSRQEKAVMVVLNPEISGETVTPARF
jgi:hypothetical protein